MYVKRHGSVGGGRGVVQEEVPVNLFHLQKRTLLIHTSINDVPLLTSVDVVPLMKTEGVVENCGHCIYFIGLKRFFQSMLLNYAYHCRNWTFQHFARAALKNGRNGINKKPYTR